MTSNGASAEFRIPQEPLPVPPVAFDERPVPYVGSDEESFVVLGKSLVSDFDDLSLEEHNLGKSIIQEAKQLIKDELERIDNHTGQEPLQDKVNGVSENHEATASQNGDEPSTVHSFHSASSNVMNQSSCLPAMPQPQLYPRVEMDGNDVSRTISIISFAPSEFASEELQTKVSHLIDENVHLKDTILQNNMSMKAQYEKIVAWQKDVEKVHEAHKEKFRQAKQCIETLRKENTRLDQTNALLQQEIENLRYSLSLKRQESDCDKSKQVLTQSSENNLKEFELEVANKRIKELEEALEQVKLKSDHDLSTASSNWKAMEEKLVRYEKELEEAYKKNRELDKNTCDIGTSSSEMLKVTEEKLLLAEQANEQINQEIISLRNQLAKNLQSTSEETTKLQFELQQSKIKIAETEEVLTSRNASLIDANMRASKAEDNIVEANGRIVNMEAAMATLQGQLEETKIEVWKQKQKLSEKESQLQMVQKELETSYQAQRAPTQNHDEIAYLRQQLMQSQMAVTQCDQNRAVAYAQLEIQKKEIADLQRQLDEKQNESDAMFALRTQLDMYKADFEAEREAKEEIKRDKNKLAEDLQHLHRRNQQLQEEIEWLREQLKQYGGVPRTRQEQTGNSSSPGATGWSTAKKTPIYKCPKCQFGFSSLTAVENHVIRCIDLDDLP